MVRALSVFADTTGAKAQNVGWFAQDVPYTKSQAGKLRVTVVLGSAVKVWATVDGGANYFVLNNDVVITANSMATFDVPLRNADQFNMKTDNATGVNVVLCRVDINAMEG